MRTALAVLMLAMLLLALGYARANSVPEGYVLQPLKETDGSILKPEDWYFDSQGTRSGWTWNFSKGNPPEK